MSLVRMAVARYRCFKQRQDIELRPLTVVLGKNNSGKSALVRSPYVFSTGIDTTLPAPLDWERLGEDVLESFTDLVFGNSPHGSIDVEFDLATPSGVYTLAATVQNLDEYSVQVVGNLELRRGDQAVVMRWVSEDPLLEAGQYEVISGRQPTNQVISFRGLLPDATREVGGVLDPIEAAEVIRSAYPAVRYIGPFRYQPARRYRLPARTPVDIGVRGENAALILADDVVRRQGRLAAHMNETLGDSLPGWSIEVSERGGMYSVLLVSRDDESLRVNLGDSGAGVSQALPIFVQRSMDVVEPPKRPVLEIIEQPELHLHPAAHGPLADVYIGAVQQTSVRFMIETHSETFLLRLRRRIAEGTLDPLMLALYYVEHKNSSAQVRRIEVDADGNLDFWPAGVFSEDYAETRALAAAQRARTNDDGR